MARRAVPLHLVLSARTSSECARHAFHCFTVKCLGSFKSPLKSVWLLIGWTRTFLGHLATDRAFVFDHCAHNYAGRCMPMQSHAHIWWLVKEVRATAVKFSPPVVLTPLVNVRAYTYLQSSSTTCRRSCIFRAGGVHTHCDAVAASNPPAAGKINLLNILIT